MTNTADNEDDDIQLKTKPMNVIVIVRSQKCKSSECRNKKLKMNVKK